MEWWGIFTETGTQNTILKFIQSHSVRVLFSFFPPQGLWYLGRRSWWNTGEDIGIKYKTEKLRTKECLLLSVQTLLIFLSQDYDELEAEHFPSLKKPSLAAAKKQPRGIETLKNDSAKAGSDVESEGGGN